MAASSRAASSVPGQDVMAVCQQLGTAELLYKTAQQMGLSPYWIKPNGLFIISTPDGDKYINFARSPLNSHVCASLAKDKYIARLLMERHNLPNIPFAKPQTREQAEEFLDLHGKIIVKPVGGSGARDIHIVSHKDELSGLNIPKYIFEKYISGKEMRYLVISGNVVGVYQSEYGISVKATRNLQCISYGEEDWDPALMRLASRIAKIFRLQFVAVDYLIDAQGKPYVLEINTTPDLKWFHAPTSGPVIDVARQFLEAIFKDPAKGAVLANTSMPSNNVMV